MFHVLNKYACWSQGGGKKVGQEMCRIPNGLAIGDRSEPFFSPRNDFPEQRRPVRRSLSRIAPDLLHLAAEEESGQDVREA